MNVLSGHFKLTFGLWSTLKNYFAKLSLQTHRVDVLVRVVFYSVNPYRETFARFKDGFKIGIACSFAMSVVSVAAEMKTSKAQSLVKAARTCTALTQPNLCF